MSHRTTSELNKIFADAWKFTIFNGKNPADLTGCPFIPIILNLHQTIKPQISKTTQSYHQPAILSLNILPVCVIHSKISWKSSYSNVNQSNSVNAYSRSNDNNSLCTCFSCCTLKYSKSSYQNFQKSMQYFVIYTNEF